MTTDLTRRRALLYAALGWCQLQPARAMPEIAAFQQWMFTWSGLGNVIVGMERQGYAASLRKIHGDGWAASFQTGPLLAPVGVANAPTPFNAVIDAAWRALNAKPMPPPNVEVYEDVL